MISDPSSSQIIDILATGNVRKFYEITGTHYRVRGLVVHGNHLGRMLGFPTANLKFSQKDPFLLAYGVYVVKAIAEEVLYNGMASAGIRPTIGGKTLTVEINLFDFDGDLYGQTLVVDFIDRLRDEIKFNNLEELMHQIRKDKIEAMRLLS